MSATGFVPEVSLAFQSIARPIRRIFVLSDPARRGYIPFLHPPVNSQRSRLRYPLERMTYT
jgi:hypothetical protein